MPVPNDCIPLPPKQAALEVGLSIAAFWRAVAAGRLPAPVYPSPRTPRWFRSELRSALEATRALPAAQKMARRAATAGARGGSRPQPPRAE